VRAGRPAVGRASIGHSLTLRLLGLLCQPCGATREIQECARAFTAIPATVEVRNQARVHLWYPAKFGVPCDRFHTCEDGIDSFAVLTCSIRTRRVGTELRTYAPHGFGDLLDLVVRPNPTRPLRTIYEAKTRRWSEVWPSLRVIAWPSESPAEGRAISSSAG
jgi:hypothetical protein